MNLLFAHWRLDVEVVRRLIAPRSAGRDIRSATASADRHLDVDTFNGETWVSVVPFGMQDVAPRGVPAIPGLSRFPELNLRLYVTRDGKPGVWFLSLDAANPIAVWAARTFFHLPYEHAAMSVHTHDGVIDYRSSRRSPRPVVFEASYRPTSGVFHPVPGTLEHWLTERYCLYTRRPDGTLLRLEIHHPPWPLQAAHGHITRNDLPLPHGFTLDGEPLMHFAAEQKMIMWNAERVGG